MARERASRHEAGQFHNPRPNKHAQFYKHFGSTSYFGDEIVRARTSSKKEGTASGGGCYLSACWSLYLNLCPDGRIHETLIEAQSQTMYSKKLGATVVLSRSLSQTAMDKELNVDGELLRSLAGDNGAEGNSFKIRVRYKSRDYKVKCRSRKTGKYKKWVFAGCGWLDLVRENENLKAGQPITIFKLPDGTAGTGAEDGDLFFMEDGDGTVSSGPKVLKRRASPVTAGYDYSVLSAAKLLMDLGRADRMIDLNSPPSPILDLNSVPCDCL